MSEVCESRTSFVASRVYDKFRLHGVNLLLFSRLTPKKKKTHFTTNKSNWLFLLAGLYVLSVYFSTQWNFFFPIILFHRVVVFIYFFLHRKFGIDLIWADAHNWVVQFTLAFGTKVLANAWMQFEVCAAICLYNQINLMWYTIPSWMQATTKQTRVAMQTWKFS